MNAFNPIKTHKVVSIYGDLIIAIYDEVNLSLSTHMSLSIWELKVIFNNEKDLN